MRNEEDAVGNDKGVREEARGGWMLLEEEERWEVG